MKHKSEILSNSVDHVSTAQFIDKISSEFKDSLLIGSLALQSKYMKSGLKSLYNLLRMRTSFEPDTGNQTIRTPYRLLRDEKGNCVDYTTFFSSVLKALEIPHYYRMISLVEGGNPTHIYIVIPDKKNEIIMDACLNRERGKPKDQSDQFNKQAAFKEKIDYIASRK